MPVDESFVGRSYPPTAPVRVGREKIREFADAINDANPAYRDVAAARALGHPDVVAPPTFATTLTMHAGAQVIADPDFGLDFSRVVHGEERYEHHRPIVAGDMLEVVLTVDSVRAVAGNDFVGLRYDVRTTGGEPVATAYSMLVGRGGVTAAGDEIPARDFPITRGDLVQYAGASGDFNPIHWNERVAAEVGLPGVIAHGMLTMATAARLVTDWAGDPGALLEYGVRFTRPVPVPDPGSATVRVGGVVKAVRADGNVEVSLTVTVGGETVLAKARAVVRPPA